MKSQRKPSNSKRKLSKKDSLRKSSTRAANRATSLALFTRIYREKRELLERIERDRTARYATYVRSVRNPGEPPGTNAKRSLEVNGDQPTLRILAEGDSWFDYPYRLEAGVPVFKQDGVITGLEILLGYSIANMAHFGLEMEQMMGLSIRKEVVSRLSGPVKFDAMLFSGGGNDLVGDPFCMWFKTTPPPLPPNQLLDEDAVSSIMALLEAEYRDLIRIRDVHSAETTIFVNCYDFPVVSGKPAICGHGPWMKPGLDYVYQQLGVQKPDANDEYLAVKALLQRFSKMLKSIEADPNTRKFVVVPTQGTLMTDDDDWQNEIHPSSQGFLSIANVFKNAIASVFS